MKLIPSPMRRDDSLTASRAGDALSLNWQVLDFTGLPEGATLPREAIACEWIAGDVSRIDGVLQIPLILPHGPIPWPAPEDARVVTHPELIEVTADGPIPLPSWSPPAEPEPIEEPAA